MTQNDNYTTQKLLESLFGKSSYSFKNLNEEEQKALRELGYRVIDWDILISEGKVTKEDVNKRVAVLKQLRAMDDEITNRKPKKEPKFKKTDVLDTKDRGKILITQVTISSNAEPHYHFTDEDGFRSSLFESDLLKILK